MTDAVIAINHGFDYQSRFFWVHAALLRDPAHPYVVEVTYEADGPKAFDDVVVRYDPARATTGAERIGVDYFQIKYHEGMGPPFTYEDLVNPAFIGAARYSILERLRQAKASAPPNSAFHLVTTSRVADGDPLESLISSEDNALRLQKLFVTGGDKSRMGKVRKLWRDHLGLGTDAELRAVLHGLHISANSRTLSALRDEANQRFAIVGIAPCTEESAFKFDAAARSLRARKIHRLTRDSFERLCQEEKWLRVDEAPTYTNVALRTFFDHPGDRFDASPERTLNLTDLFDGRWLKEGLLWNEDVKPQVIKFLGEQRQGLAWIRLFLDAHQGVAFLAGHCLGLKSGVGVELVQKGRLGTAVWSAQDGRSGPEPKWSATQVGDGEELAVAISLTREILPEVQRHAQTLLPQVGKILHVTAPARPSQALIAGGVHAAVIAEVIAAAIKAIRVSVGATVHLFAASPNALLFYLGQEQVSLGPCQLYEYDFAGERGGGYVPALRIP